MNNYYFESQCKSELSVHVYVYMSLNMQFKKKNKKFAQATKKKAQTHHHLQSKVRSFITLCCALFSVRLFNQIVRFYMKFLLAKAQG